jgi:predicted TIM-barrel fold metal-dependent hydrolase
MKPEMLVDFMDRNGIRQANLVLVPNRQRLTSVPEAMVAKAKFPGRFYVFTSLDVSEYFRHGKEVGKFMARFVASMQALGCDGLKLIEGKPSMRKMLPVPGFDDPVWEPLWTWAEETGLPILWHVNDPETCWQPEKHPVISVWQGNFMTKVM